MTDKGLFIEEIIINSLKSLLAGRVNELLGETEYPLPPIEFGNYRGGSAVVPVIVLSTCERKEKERIVRLDAYALSIAFAVPDEAPFGSPNGDAENQGFSAACCYAYASSVIKTAYQEMGVPYAEETIREAASLLTEEASIEGDGSCRAIRKSGGATGCVVTPLAIGTAPLLLYLAMGSVATEGCVGLPLYVSETRNLYLYKLSLLPMEDSARFDLAQERGGSRKLYEGCAVTGFELRIVRKQAVKLKLDISGERSPSIYPYTDPLKTETGERFMGDRVAYRINGQEHANIYGLTLSVKKEGGTKTELWIKRVLQQSSDLPGVIEELIITAQLLRDRYEHRHYGMFRITLKRLALMADETAVDAADAVIGPLRYYVAGTVNAEVYSENSIHAVIQTPPSMAGG